MRVEPIDSPTNTASDGSIGRGSAVRVSFKDGMGLSSNISRISFDVPELPLGLGINFFQIRLSMFDSRLDGRTKEIERGVDSPWDQSWLGQGIQGGRHRRHLVAASFDYSVILVITGGVFEGNFSPVKRKGFWQSALLDPRNMQVVTTYNFSPEGGSSPS